MAERNAEVPQDRRITRRVGINLGDVIAEGEDIFGDGVNVAARFGRRSPSPEGSASAGSCAIRCVTGLITPSTI
jgi:class 3 adenylate cyclase